MAIEKLKNWDEEKGCITRKGRGKGFEYFDANGIKISDSKSINRLKSLAIPPAWQKVSICPFENGKVQATGYDPAGRKQYIYHQVWEEFSNKQKFDNLVSFIGYLPTIRKKCSEILKKSDVWDSKDYVLAVAVILLDNTGIRIGNRQYSTRNKTYGLTTLRRRHINLEDDGHLKLEFIGKSHKDRSVDIDDSDLVEEISHLAENPGYELFSYSKNGNKHTITAFEINGFISDAAPGFSSKYFRTLHANRLAFELLPEARRRMEEVNKSNYTLDMAIVDIVSQELGNTKTVCRSYYLHPHILNSAREGGLDYYYNKYIKNGRDGDGLLSVEKALVRFLNNRESLLK